MEFQRQNLDGRTPIINICEGIDISLNKRDKCNKCSKCQKKGMDGAKDKWATTERSNVTSGDYKSEIGCVCHCVM
jgi:hypothetical protein